MDEPMTKEKLLKLIQTEHTNLEQVLASLDETQMTEPGVLGEWSVKDILSHIPYWEQRMLNRFRTGQVPPVPEGMTWEQMIDVLNEQNYLENREKSLSEVRNEFQRSHEEVMYFLDTLSDDDLNNPGRFEWNRGEPVWHYIRGDTYAHYQEHAEQINAWRAKLKS